MISIVIVNWNGKKWLKKLFNSLLYQTYKNFEILFVDNNSNDDSIGFIKNKYNDNRIKIIKSDKNLGFSGGNNLGIKKSKGEYILLLNSDVWFENNFIEKLFNFYEDNNFDVITPYLKDYENKRTTKSYYSTIDFLGHHVIVSNKSGSVDFYLGGACLFFNKRIYKETLGLDDNFFMYSEDVDWFWRMNLMKKRIGRIKDLFIYHEGTGSTGKGIKYNVFLWRNQNTLQMLLKNYTQYNLLWVLPIYFIQNIFEMIFFIVILKPKIAYSYVQGWWFNIVNFKKIMQKRRWVQENRLVGDFEIMRRMYIGPGKVKHLLDFYKSNDSKKSL